MTGPGPSVTPTKEEQAMSLHLAGAPPEQIGKALGLSEVAVRSAVDIQLAARQPGTPADDALELERLSALWRGIYAKAVGGDKEAVNLALRIGAYRNELQARARTRRPADDPLPEPPTEQTSSASVRTAWSILAGNAPHVAQVLVDIARYSPNDSARVPAAIAILDRVGIGRVERSEVAVHLLDSSAAAVDAVDGVPTGPAALVRQRLAALRARAEITVIDAEDQ
jgi:hypothetical protein